MIVKISLRKVRSTWYWTAYNDQGGSFGSTHAGSKKVALQVAAVGVQPGQLFWLVTNEKAEGYCTVDAAGKVIPVTDEEKPDLCPACGKLAMLSDARERGVEFTEALCDGCRSREIREVKMDSFDRSYERARANGWAD